MKSFWNQRYSQEEFVYGKEPNDFFKQEIQKISPGKLLLPGEGEGRNAVFAAKLGWEVTAFDYSKEAKIKAETLAKEVGVTLKYFISDFDSVDLNPYYFDCIALIYVHPPKEKRTSVHKNLLGFLKNSGTVILEGFAKNQIKNASGGPKNIDILFSSKELANDYSSLSKIKISEKTILLNEGPFHQGEASVIQVLGKK